MLSAPARAIVGRSNHIASSDMAMRRAGTGEPRSAPMRRLGMVPLPSIGMIRPRTSGPFIVVLNFSPHVISRALDDGFPAGVLAAGLRAQRHQQAKGNDDCVVN
jgi:hypothetical protein